MTPEQRATLENVTTWVRAADELLTQAKNAIYTREMWSATENTTRYAITDAADAARRAAAEMEIVLEEIEYE